MGRFNLMFVWKDKGIWEGFMYTKYMLLASIGLIPQSQCFIVHRWFCKAHKVNDWCKIKLIKYWQPHIGL